MKTFDAILVTDTATYQGPRWSRGYGAHRLASHLRSNGYTVLVLDFCSALTFDHWQEICNYAIGDNTRMVGFSTTWWPYRDPNGDGPAANDITDYTLLNSLHPEWKPNQFMYDVVTKQSQKWIDFVKQKNKKTKIIIGGPKLDAYTDFPADHFVKGFGENQVLDFLNERLRIWPKVIEHDVNSNNKEWGWITSSTSYTDYDFLQPDEMLNLEIARGCKFHCNFCSFPLLGQKDTAMYYKTEETIYNELLTNYERWGITQYNIADDTFNDDLSKVEMMARIVRRLPFKPKFFAYVRVDLIAVHPEQIELLKEMGLRWCYIGIETFHPVASKFSGKGMKEDKRKETLVKMHQAWGDTVSIDAGYIVGLPGEPESFIREQVEWFKRDDCPINHNMSFIALIISPAHLFKFVFPSKIDKEPEKFGYSIPDISKPHSWIKDDGTDITSYEVACKIAASCESEVKTRKNILNHNQMVDSKINPHTDYFIPLIEKLKNG